MADEEQSWTDQATDWASQTYDQAATAVSETYDQVVTDTSATIEQARTLTNETVDGAVAWAGETYQEAEAWVSEHADLMTNDVVAGYEVPMAQKGLEKAYQEQVDDIERLKDNADRDYARVYQDVAQEKRRLVEQLTNAHLRSGDLQVAGDQADPHECTALSHTLDGIRDSAIAAGNLAADLEDFEYAAHAFYETSNQAAQAAQLASAAAEATDKQAPLDSLPVTISYALNPLYQIAE